MLHVPTPAYGKLILVAALLGAAAFGWWTLSPLFITKTVSEPLMEKAGPPTGGETFSPLTYRTGAFAGREGHAGQGTVRIINRGGDLVVRFDDDFEVTNGPDLFVYFGNNGSYDARANLGPLKGNVGSQNYVIPSEIDYAKYSEVWIWCRAFRTPFAVAELK